MILGAGLFLDKQLVVLGGVVLEGQPVFDDQLGFGFRPEFNKSLDNGLA